MPNNKKTNATTQKTTFKTGTLYEYATANTMVALKKIYSLAAHNTTLDIIQGRKPETMQDLVQSFLESLLSSGIDLTMPTHCISAHAKNTIVHVTKTGKEKSALAMAYTAIHNTLRHMQNGVATIRKKDQKTGKTVTLPVLSLATLDSGTDYHNATYYIDDMRTEDSIRAAHIAIIQQHAKNVAQAEKMAVVYTLMVDGYKQTKIAETMSENTVTIHRIVEKIRAILSAENA